MARAIWPAMTDYVAAVQNPQLNLTAPELVGVEIVTLPPLGLPATASGQNAVVFQGHLGGETMAIRCFTSAAGLGRERYLALAEHLAHHRLPALASSRWIDDGIRVGDRTWPVVTMEWVEGPQLGEHVAGIRNDPTALRSLADRWGELCADLRSARVAHGDLQHGNVLVEPGGRLRLIDFDGVWLPSIADRPPSEWGHPNYQHPARLDEAAWGEHIDWFSALVVHLSLLALAADPSLWDHHDGENLIVRASDLCGPAELWERLGDSPDPRVRDLSSVLATACALEPLASLDLAWLLDVGIGDRTLRRRPPVRERLEPQPPTPPVDVPAPPPSSPPAETVTPRHPPPPIPPAVEPPEPAPAVGPVVLGPLGSTDGGRRPAGPRIPAWLYPATWLVAGGLAVILATSGSDGALPAAALVLGATVGGTLVARRLDR